MLPHSYDRNEKILLQEPNGAKLCSVAGMLAKPSRHEGEAHPPAGRRSFRDGVASDMMNRPNPGEHY